ncbi:MAG: hypothetical protein ACP5E3_01430 [Bacteroidales bacterium]
MKTKNAHLKGLLYLIGATLALMLPTLINQYPIVYSDSATYIVSGFVLEPPFDRPLTYGLFVRMASLNGLTLWTVIGFQSMLLAWLVLRIIKKFSPGSTVYYGKSFLIVLLLSLLSSVSWTASQLIPDIFTPILFLSTVLILMGEEKKGTRIFLYIIFFLSTAMHIAHLSYNIVFLAVILILRQLNIFRLKEKIKLVPVVIMVMLTFASIVTMGSALSKSKHVFLMGAMVEHGILEKYLEENCETKEYKLCAYKDSLPEYAWQFIWDEDSPFYKVGGWKGTKEEFNEIFRNTLKDPKYLALHIKESFKATARQLVRFKIGDGNGVFAEGTPLYENIKKYIPRESTAFLHSKQNQGNLQFIKTFNYIQQAITGFALIILLILVYLKRNRPGFRNYFILITFNMLAIFINAWVSGTFANAIDRLGAKMMWMVLFLVLVGVLNNIASTSADS